MISGITSFSFTPIYIIGLAGLAGLAAAPLLGLIGLIVALFGASAAGWLWTALALLLWGSLMASVGTVGLYVARAYKEVRRRPRWIVESALGIEPRPDPAAAPVRG
jgi:hypothetical protein